jgi:hypothetical protein
MVMGASSPGFRSRNPGKTLKNQFLPRHSILEASAIPDPRAMRQTVKTSPVYPRRDACLFGQMEDWRPFGLFGMVPPAQ